MTTSFRPITHLRHVGMAVPDFSRSLDFYTKLWGLEVAADDGRYRLPVNARRSRAVHNSSAKGSHQAC